MTKYVYDFSEGHKGLKDLLGGKGANLCEMVRLGLPVPPGFIISTEACRVYLRDGKPPVSLEAEVDEHLSALERSMGRKLGDPANPLLVSVRSGGKFSMPGMMETVLNVGLTDASVVGLAATSGNERFAWDSYRRLIQMFGKTVCGVPSFPHDDKADPRELVTRYKEIFREHTGRDFPQDPREQLDMATAAVFDSWNTERAIIYRRQERIPADLGTAVSIVAMVFGNLSADSGTGVAFTRDPSTGHRGIYGDYLANAQGEDVVAGIRNTVQLDKMPAQCFAELKTIMSTLESNYRDLCDIEFTVERGKLWMLQTRVGKRTAAAAFTIACHLVEEGIIDMDEALRRVSGGRLAQLMFPRFDDSERPEPLASGVGASPGAAVGKVVFTSAAAVAAKQPVILVRRETNPDDLPGMIASQGILTSRGGKTSHAAVVARGMGKTCVCGADSIVVGEDSFVVGETTVREGDVISIDGTTGKVYLGEIPVSASPVVQYFDGTIDAEADPLVTAVDKLMRHADGVRRLKVRTNADTGEDAARARRFGAQGVGLTRTEHMFLGDRRPLIERLVLATSATEQRAALDALLPLQRKDFADIFRAMQGLPVTIRLIDPPLHEFLPPLEELAVKVATGEGDEHDKELLGAVRRMHEQNPMLGLRGVRLGLVIPGLFEMQVRAIVQAYLEVPGSQPEIMVPLVGAVQELEAVRSAATAIMVDEGLEHHLPVGTMIEVPRAALTAGQIAHAADFFSFGTNDLTQMGWGFSRDDVEGTFFARYLELGIFGVSPFETLDRDGIGRLVRLAVDEGRAVKPDLKIGVCGEHGGDPESVHFFHTSGLDYVSCSPFRVPIARLEAGRAVVLADGTSDE
ncbi:pyruvate, phosphate dikinase [Rhizocola hellebori]|uniref:Pyruvate, phosphate dikinase n=1 Tax=Rhizocola hellebori TaxID=1392758 RepID=A0A8J3VEC5_9ACTN|nr:pyruvate, phosphate dikinase [Rhizocola hellebori]GIH03237.1 pyruvate, phosphate dikinase [Rhizocola hellebori]